MTASRRKKKPYNPALADYQRQLAESEDAKRRDRKSRDLLRNAQVAALEISDPSGDKIVVLRSTRDDPLGDMHARRQIDDAQYQGGRAFQRDFEAAERGPRAIDPGKEAVDGGVMPEPITEAQRRAGRQLAQVYRVLGQDGSAMAHDALVHCKTRKQIALARGLSGKRWEEYFGLRVQEVLHRLAHVYGFANEKTGKARMKEVPVLQG